MRPQRRDGDHDARQHDHHRIDVGDDQDRLPLPAHRARPAGEERQQRRPGRAGRRQHADRRDPAAHRHRTQRREQHPRLRQRHRDRIEGQAEPHVAGTPQERGAVEDRAHRIRLCRFDRTQRGQREHAEERRTVQHHVDQVGGVEAAGVDRTGGQHRADGRHQPEVDPVQRAGRGQQVSRQQPRDDSSAGDAADGARGRVDRRGGIQQPQRGAAHQCMDRQHRDRDPRDHRRDPRDAAPVEAVGQGAAVETGDDDRAEPDTGDQRHRERRRRDRVDLQRDGDHRHLLPDAAQRRADPQPGERAAGPKRCDVEKQAALTFGGRRHRTSTRDGSAVHSDADPT